MNRGQLVFSILALLVVFSLIVGALGTIIFDGLTNPDFDDDPIVVNEETPDVTEEELRTEVAQSPNDATTLAALANYLAQTGRLSEAIDYYEQALTINPTDWLARLDFARSLADGGKRLDAELQFQKVIAGDPTNPQAHYYLAVLYRNWVPPRLDEAASEFRRTIETGPETFIAELALQALQELGYATPVPAASPAVITAEATP